MEEWSVKQNRIAVIALHKRYGAAGHTPDTSRVEGLAVCSIIIIILTETKAHLSKTRKNSRTTKTIIIINIFVKKI